MKSDPFHATVDELRSRSGVKWTKEADDVIGAFIAEMDFGTAPLVTEAMHDAVDRGYLNYLSDVLDRDLSEALAAWYRRTTGWSPDPLAIHSTGDVVRGLEAVARHYSPEGSALILPTPAYMPFFDIPAEIGRELILVPTLEEDGHHRLDLDAIVRAFGAGGGLLLLTNPWNPVGRVLTEPELVALSEAVDSVGGRVFVDEIHAPLVFPGHRHVPYASVSTAAAAHSVTAISASKAWNLPGLKCANLVFSNPDDAARWDEVGLMLKHGASTLGVVANAAAYRDESDWLASVIDQLIRNRELLGTTLAERCPEIGHRSPEGTYLAWLDCRRLDLGDDPAGFFLDAARVALTDGARCGAPGFVRLNLATTTELLTELLDRMATALGR